jgi:hypothetical protein
MLTLSNAFVLFLLAAAAWVAVAAMVQKRSNRWYRDDRVSPAPPIERID